MTFWLIFPWLLVAVLTVALLLRGRGERRRAAGQAKALSDQAPLSATLIRLRQAVESASDAIGIDDLEGASLYHNRAHRALFGHPVADLKAMEGDGGLFADAGVARAIRAAVRGGNSWAGETEVRTKDGRLVPCHVRADVIRDEQGRAVGIFNVFTDVTERRRAQRHLDEQRVRLELTLQSISDAVIATDVEGRVVLLNLAAQQMTGLAQTS
jgi:PAS domain S-box-containing protein